MAVATSTADAPAAVHPESRLYSKGYRAWLLTMLLVVNALNLTDRQTIAITSPAIKADLHLTDTQLGLMQGLGFAIFFTLLALPMARMAERMSRTTIIAASIAVFGAMVALCGTVQAFWQLMLARIGVGVGDAGFGPPVSSLIGDHYPRERRASAMSIIWLGAPIGAVTGAVFGGWMAEHVSWRAAFVAVGTPGLVVALIAFFTLREPPRGMSDPVAATSGPPPSIGKVLRFLLSKRSFVHVLIGAGLAATTMNGLGQFFARYFVSNFHMGFAEAGRVLGLMAGVAMASGLTLGGFGVDWAGKFDRRWAVWAPAIGLVLSAPLFVVGINQPTVFGAVAVMMVAHVALFVYYTPTLALAQNMVGASMRASSAFVVSLVLGLVGIGFGPTIVGILSDVFAHLAFTAGDFNQLCVKSGAGTAPDIAEACSAASAAGIRHSLMTMSCLLVWAGLHFWLAGRSLRQDLDRDYVE